MSYIFSKIAKKLEKVDTENLNMRIKECMFLDLERFLIMWHSQTITKLSCISDQIMIEKAKEFGDMLKITALQYSQGWLNKFKCRYGIKQQ